MSWKAAYGGGTWCPDGLHPREPKSATDLHCWRCEMVLVVDEAEPPCSCCSDPTPADDEEFYLAPWCGVCGHPGWKHARPSAGNDE